MHLKSLYLLKWACVTETLHEYRPEITPYLDTFYAVKMVSNGHLYPYSLCIFLEKVSNQPNDLHRNYDKILLLGEFNRPP